MIRASVAACGLALLIGTGLLAVPQSRPATKGRTAAPLPAVTAAAASSPGRVDTLRAVAALPVEVVGVFRDALGYERLPSGDSLVFDRRGHAVYLVPADRSAARRLVVIGGEDGRVIEPTAFDAASDGTFVVADAPNGRERVQIFAPDGRRAGGFQLPGRATARVTLGALSLSGVGTLQFTGRSVLISQPETGGLMTEYGLAGTPVRTIGRLRATGHEADRDLHLALNAGIPLKDADGGYWFVFLAGEPALSRFDAAGQLLFHRRMQGLSWTRWWRPFRRSGRAVPSTAPKCRWSPRRCAPPRSTRAADSGSRLSSRSPTSSTASARRCGRYSSRPPGSPLRTA